MRVAKSKHYEFNNEMFSAITHAFALGLAVVGTIALGIKGANSGSQLELISYLGFGISSSSYIRLQRRSTVSILARRAMSYRS